MRRRPSHSVNGLPGSAAARMRRRTLAATGAARRFTAIIGVSWRRCAGQHPAQVRGEGLIGGSCDWQNRSAVETAESRAADGRRAHRRCIHTTTRRLDAPATTFKRGAPSPSPSKSARCGVSDRRWSRCAVYRQPPPHSLVLLARLSKRAPRARSQSKRPTGRAEPSDPWSTPRSNCALWRAAARVLEHELVARRR